MSQSRQSKVFLAVYPFILRRQVIDELIVDDGIRSLEGCVGFLHAHVEGVAIDRRTIGEGHQLSIHIDGAACGIQLEPVVKDIFDSLALVDFVIGVPQLQAFVYPRLVEVEACLHVALVQSLILIVGIVTAEAVEKVALALQFVASERGEGITRIHIVGVVFRVGGVQRGVGVEVVVENVFIYAEDA